MDVALSCRKARYLAALAPDGVLSEFEQRLVDSHIARCAACCEFATDVAETTETLRVQPLEQPQLDLQLRAQFRRPTRRRIPRLSFLTAASVAATVAAATVVGVGNNGGHQVQTDRPVIVIDATSIDAETDQSKFLHDLRDYRNAQHTTESSLASDRRPGFNAG